MTKCKFQPLDFLQLTAEQAAAEVPSRGACIGENRPWLPLGQAYLVFKRLQTPNAGLGMPRRPSGVLSCIFHTAGANPAILPFPQCNHADERPQNRLGTPQTGEGRHRDGFPGKTAENGTGSVWRHSGGIRRRQDKCQRVRHPHGYGVGMGRESGGGRCRCGTPSAGGGGGVGVSPSEF